MGDMRGYEDLFTPQAPPASKQLTASAQTDAPQGYEDLFNPNTELKASPTGQTQEPLPGWASGFKGLTDRLTIGGASISKAGAGWMLLGGTSLEDAQAHAETQDLLRAQQDTEDYANAHGLPEFMRAKDVFGRNVGLADLVGWGVEQVPQLGAAAGGAAYGGMVGSVFGPAGVGIGALAGGGLAIGTMAMGDHVYEQMKVGVHRNDALLGGLLVGAFTGAAEMTGLFGVGKALPDAARIVANSPTFKAAAKQLITTFAKATGIEILTEDAESLVESGVKLWNQPKNGTSFTLGDAWKDLAASTIQAAVVAPQMGGVTTGLGIRTGLNARKIRDEIEKIVEARLLEEQRIQTAVDDAEAQDTAKREKATAERTVVKQAEAKRALRGFVEVQVTPDVETAQQAVDAAKAGVKAVEKGTKLEQTRARLALEQAQAELKESQLVAQLEAIDEALNDKNLAETVQVRKETLEQQIALIEGMLDEKAPAVPTPKQQLIEEAEKDQAAKLARWLELKDLSDTQTQVVMALNATYQLNVFDKKAKKALQDANKVGLRIEENMKAASREYKKAAEHLEAVKETAEFPQPAPKDALSPDVRKVLQGELGKLKNALRTVSDMGQLSGEQLREQVAEQKAKVDRRLEVIRRDKAASQVRHTIAKREARIVELESEVVALAPVAQEQAERLQERAEQLQQQNDIDQLILELIEENFDAVQDVVATPSQLPTSRIVKLVGLAKKQIEKAADAGKVAQEKLTKAIKRLLDGIVKVSRLPDEDKKSLRLELGKINTFDDLADKFPALEGQIRELFEKRRQEAAVADLKKVTSKLAADKTGMSKTPGTEELLLFIRDAVNDAEVITKLILETQNLDELTEIEEKKLELVQLFPAEVKDLTADEIERIIDTAVSLRETGKAEALKRIEQRKARQDYKKGVLKKRLSRTAKGKARQSQAILGTLNKLLDDYIQAPVNSWRGLMTIISQFGDMSDMADILDLKSALSEMHRIRILWEARFKAIVNEFGLDDATWQKLNIDGNKRGDKLKYHKVVGEGDDAEIQVFTLEHPDTGKALTLWEMVQVRNYLLDQDSDAKSRLGDGNFFSYPDENIPGMSTLEVIESYLNDKLPNWRKGADAMRQFYKEFQTVVDEATFKRFGRHIPRNDTYGGELLSSTEPGTRFRERFRRMTTRPGSMKARQGGDKRVKVRNAVENLTNHISQYAREIALFEFEQDAQALFTQDQDTRDFITKNIGENTLKAIDTYISDVVLGYNHAHDAVDKLFSWLRESLYTRFLAARPEQFAKQLTGMVNALEVVGPGAMVDGLDYFIAFPDESIALMNESGLLQARHLQRDPDFKPGATHWLRQKGNMLMKSVEVGDTYGVYGSSFPVLLSTLRKTGNKARALRDFETAFDTTQSSGSIDELPLIFRKGPMMRIFTVLAQQPTRQVEKIATAWRALVAGKGSKSQFLRTAAVAYAGAILYQLVGWMILYPFLSDDEREKKLNFILAISPLGPFAGVAILGNLLSFTAATVYKYAVNPNTRAYEPELLATNPAGDLAQVSAKLFKIGFEGADDDDLWQLLLLTSDFIGGVTGLPVTNILKWGERIAKTAGVNQ